jgi:hypothetical protein
MSISRYTQQDGNLIYLPTIEACDFFKINRLPKNYSGGTSAGSSSFNLDAPNPDVPTQPYATPSVGPQFSTFNTTNYINSLKQLSLPAVNTRDIVIEVLGNRPYTIKTKTVDGVTTSEYNYGEGTNGSTPYYRLSIAPTNPDSSPFELEICHEHDWGTQSDIFSSILRGASQLVGQADDFIQKIKNIGQAQGVGGKDGFKQLPNRRFDLAETYSTTKKQSIEIPFTLFTPGGNGSNGQENFLRDILDPITLITSFSYPKRQTELGQGPLGQLADFATTTATGDPNANVVDTINALNPGFRVFVSDPPSYVNVYHQGGLFSYKNCYIQKFTYKFKNFVDGANGEIKDIVTDRNSGVSGILKSISANANLAYPVIAECKLEIGTTEPLFSDDFIALSNDRSNAAQSTGGLTSVRTVPVRT